MGIMCKQCRTVDDYRTEVKSNNTTAYCNSCGAFIKNIPTDVPRMYIGKFKGLAITEINDLDYLIWAHDNMRALNKRQKDAVKDRIYNLQNLLR